MSAMIKNYGKVTGTALAGCSQPLGRMLCTPALRLAVKFSKALM